MIGKKMNIEDSKKFLLSGLSTFTFLNTKTGNNFRYKISISDDGKLFFVSALIDEKYSYLGTINKNLKYTYGIKSKISKDQQTSKVFLWVIERIFNNTLPDYIEVWHEGKCGKCGRKLTTPKSIDNGIGPECIKNLSKNLWRELQLNILGI
jgi:hypothetical protein